MAFPATQITLEAAWSKIRARAVKIKANTQALVDASAAGDTQRSAYVSLMQLLTQTIDDWAGAASTPGLQPYARDQVSDPTLDLQAEYLAMRTAAISLRDWIGANLPKSGDALLEYSIDSLGNRTALTLTTAQTAGFRSQAQNLLNSIG